MPVTVKITGGPCGQSRGPGSSGASGEAGGEPGRDTPGGSVSGGNASGRDASGREAPGSSASGGDTAGGRTPGGSWRRGMGVILIGAGLVMLPWLVVLAAWLPGHYQAAHWAMAWVGLDGMEAAGLLATGWLVLRGDPWRCLPATATAVLLTVDAWFDIATAAPGQDQAVAIAMAICPELPVAALCATLAVRSLPRRGTACGASRVLSVPPKRQSNP